MDAKKEGRRENATLPFELEDVQGLEDLEDDDDKEEEDSEEEREEDDMHASMEKMRPHSHSQ